MWSASTNFDQRIRTEEFASDHDKLTYVLKFYPNWSKINITGNLTTHAKPILAINSTIIVDGRSYASYSPFFLFRVLTNS